MTYQKAQQINLNNLREEQDWFVFVVDCSIRGDLFYEKIFLIVPYVETDVKDNTLMSG